jgi:hypothetical protein
MHNDKQQRRHALAMQRRLRSPFHFLEQRALGGPPYEEKAPEQ